MALKEDRGRGTYKIGYEEAQPDTNKDEEVEWITRRKREAYEDNVNCIKTATRDGNRHGSECQYCEKNNTEVSLEER